MLPIKSGSSVDYGAKPIHNIRGIFMTLRKKSLLLAAVSLTLVVALAVANALVVIKVNDAWKTQDSEVTTRRQLLGEIKEQFGYGGVIHNFKNFVLRGTPKYGERIAKNRDAVLSALETYRALAQGDGAELAAFKQVESVLTTYFGHVPTVGRMWAEGATPVEVDKTVKVSDGPAFEGFKVLEERLSALAAVSEARMERLQEWQKGLGVATFLILAGLLAWSVYTLRRTAGDIEAVAAKTTSIAAEQDYDRRLALAQADELGNLGHSFDHLLDDLQRTLSISQAVLNAIPEPIFLVDDEYKLLVANESTGRMVGKRPEELGHLRCGDIFATAVCNSENCPVEKVKRGFSMHH